MHKFKFLLTPLLALGLAACAHKDKEHGEHHHDHAQGHKCEHKCEGSCDLKHKAQGELKGAPGAEIKKNAADIFMMQPGLTDAQKQKLGDIVRKVSSEGAEIRKQIADAKTDLFKVASSKAFNSKEVTEIRDKITKLDQKRLAIMYKALADVQAVVGFGPEKEELYRRLREYDNPPEGHLSRSMN